MKDWCHIELGRFIDLINGFAFPSEKFTEGEGIPLIRIRDLDNQTTEINYQGEFSDRYLVNNGDLLVGMDGDFSTVKWKGGSALLNQRVCKLVSKDAEELDQDFLFYRIIEEIKKIHRITSATTVKHLSSKDVLGIQLDLPETDEQAQIAEILSTIDQAIEQTEAIIAKQLRIKTGLMQDLLTCGIDEHGDIRSEQTHQFKDSLLGRIPVDWEAKELGNVATIKYGISDAIDLTRRSGIATITLPCVSPAGELNLNPQLLAYTSPKTIKDTDLLRKGDLLFNWRNGSQHHLGKTAYFNEDSVYTHVGFLLRLRTNEQSCNSKYLWYLINDIKAKGYFLTAKIQVNNTFNSSELKRVALAFPPIAEQVVIIQKIDSLEHYISHESKKLHNMRVIKTGLMHDLLTGKVRVTPLLTEPQEAGT